MDRKPFQFSLRRLMAAVAIFAIACVGFNALPMEGHFQELFEAIFGFYVVLAIFACGIGVIAGWAWVGATVFGVMASGWTLIVFWL